jgi:16S rRNA (uracil1498-N3)-methyltransferase
MRKKIGDSVFVLDGNGCKYTAIIIRVDKNILLEVKHKNKVSKNRWKLHLIISPTKSHDRIDWLIEKATEIGVKKISFIQCSRTERKKINIDRIKRISISAIKQSGQFYIPEIMDINSYDQIFFDVCEDQRFIAHLEGGDKKHLASVYDKSKSCCILIGPEGDFTNDEINSAKENNFQSISLGKSTLRTETAGIFAVSVVNTLDE